MRVFDGADHELVWPRVLFVREAEVLLGQAGRGDWSDRVEWLLAEAFAGPAAADAFRAVPATSGWPPVPTPGFPQHAFLADLVRHAGQLREAAHRAPYWSQRRHGAPSGPLPWPAFTQRFVGLVDELRGGGYLGRAFPTPCVDDRDLVPVDPAEVLEERLGAPVPWPLRPEQFLPGLDEDLLLDVVEVLHDLVARPRSRRFHDHGGCGWHYGDFALEPARVLYRWRVNRLLERSDLGLRLADEGEDAGRLVAATDDARGDLAQAMAARADDATGDRVRHALALFRGRAATEHDKRSAVVALAGVLEERRTLLKEHLLTKDEGALFQIANAFAIRHQNESQKAGYDPAFLGWVFWWYLATVELTDRLLARRAAATA